MNNKLKDGDNIIQNMTTVQCVGCPVQENGNKTGPIMDSDSYQIAIDSCCSYSIAQSWKYFTGFSCHATSNTGTGWKMCSQVESDMEIQNRR